MIEWHQEWKKLAGGAIVFAVLFWLPVGWGRFNTAVLESLHLAKWYAREHVLLCLVPAFFIAGAIGVFVSSASVMKYLGAGANKVLAYGVASVSGTILAVCSCTVLPLFAGIHRMGAGIGPATAFLYSGPAINVLAIILTARILGFQLGVARAVAAILSSVLIGLTMHVIYRREEKNKANTQLNMPEPEVTRPLWQNALFFFVMIGVLVFANWGAPNDYRFTTTDGQTFRAAITEHADTDLAKDTVMQVKMLDGPQRGEQIEIASSSIVEKVPLPGVWTSIWKNKWAITSVFACALGVVLVLWFEISWWKLALVAAAVAAIAILFPTRGMWILLPFSVGWIGLAMVLGRAPGQGQDWLEQSWSFARQIMPLLLGGVVVAGFLLGRPGHEGMIPSKYVEMCVGDQPETFLSMTGWSNSGSEGVIRQMWPLWTNLFASIFGAFMYFATLTEVPILQGLIAAGMGKGPALALLLAGPALSLPNMLVIGSVLGARKTFVFCSIVVVAATASGMIYGSMF